MQLTALRAVSKINSNVLQNFRRLYSFKFEMTPANRIVEQSEDAKAAAAPPSEEPRPVSFRYNVCQPRTTPVDKAMMGDIPDVQRQSARAAIEEQQLQPSMLPEYYQKHMEKNALVNPETVQRINKPNNQRRFQESKTYANAILPLKNVKLANPFPEPVKMMMSRTVSDDEKAEQMLAESKSHRTFSDLGNKPSYRSFSTVRRWFSSSVSDSEKCKKFVQKKESGCPKMKLKHCAPPARAKCDRLAKHIDCKKQEAPYPAYSEFCHEDLEEKPSECKLCPWKPEENPNFKPSKKNLHTASQNMLRRSGLEVELKKYQRKPAMEEVVMKAEVVMKGKEDLEGMQCDLRKPQCERPKNRRCPPQKGEKKKEDKLKKKKDKPKKAAGPTSRLSLILDEDGVLPVEKTRNILQFKEKKDEAKKQDSCKIKKFKFPGCVEKRVQQEEQTKIEKCPTKKKKPKIRDCPPDDDKKLESLDELIGKYSLKEEKVEGYNLREKEKGQSFILKEIKQDKGQKCPDVDLTTWKQEEDPCHKKKQGTTKICPGDLLKKKKKRSPKKKSSAVITPVDSKVDMPQPTKTI